MLAHMTNKTLRGESPIYLSHLYFLLKVIETLEDKVSNEKTIRGVEHRLAQSPPLWMLDR